MYAMDSAVHTEHSSEQRRTRRESWRDRWHAPAHARTPEQPTTSPADWDPTDFAD